MPEDLFKDAHKLLKTGGVFILTCPFGDRIRSQEHMWFVSREDVEELYQRHGFSTPNFEKVRDMEHTYVIYAVGTKL